MSELPVTVGAYMEQFDDALRLTGRRRRRVLAEVEAHLREACERGVAAGAAPWEAPAIAVAQFGDPIRLAATFGSDWIVSWDIWHGDHPYLVALSEVVVLSSLGAVLIGWWVLFFTPVYLAIEAWQAFEVSRSGEIGYLAKWTAMLVRRPTWQLGHIALVLVAVFGVYFVFRPAMPTTGTLGWIPFCAAMSLWQWASKRGGRYRSWVPLPD